MLYEHAKRILGQFPRPRVRVTLVSGEVIETPAPMLAAVSPRECAVSADGSHCRYFRWSQIASFETLPSDATRPLQ